MRSADTDTEILIRNAVADETAVIAEIWHTGWRDGHLGHVPQGLLQQRTSTDFLLRSQARLSEFRVAIVDEVVAGFVLVLDDEIEQVYVDRHYRGTAVANRLLSAAEHAIFHNGHARAWLAVVAGNTRARAFYERNGWTNCGASPYQAAFGSSAFEVPALVYEKRFQTGA